jgi:hypothetical protein
MGILVLVHPLIEDADVFQSAFYNADVVLFNDSMTVQSLPKAQHLVLVCNKEHYITLPFWKNTGISQYPIFSNRLVELIQYCKISRVDIISPYMDAALFQSYISQAQSGLEISIYHSTEDGEPWDLNENTSFLYFDATNNSWKGKFISQIMPSHERTPYYTVDETGNRQRIHVYTNTDNVPLYKVYDDDLRNVKVDDGKLNIWGNDKLTITGTTILNSNTYLEYHPLPPDIDDILCVCITKNNYAAAVIRDDGSVVSWGYAHSGGAMGGHNDTYQWTGAPIFVTEPSSGVVALYSNTNAFCALKYDGTVFSWGNYWAGGYMKTSIFDSHIVKQPAILSNVQEIYNNAYTFTSLHNDGTITVWGDTFYGAGISGENIVTITANDYGYAAIKSDNSILTWGAAEYSFIENVNNIKTIYANEGAFTAHHLNNTITTWGHSNYTTSTTQNNIVAIYSNRNSFIGVDTENMPHAWGHITITNTPVIRVYPHENGYLAITPDYTCIGWGGNTLLTDIPETTTNTKAIYVNVANAMTDKLIMWGISGDIEAGYPTYPPDISPTDLTIYNNGNAYAATKNNELYTWGMEFYGGNGSTPYTEPIRYVYSLNYGFIGLHAANAFTGRDYTGMITDIKGIIQSISVPDPVSGMITINTIPPDLATLNSVLLTDANKRQRSRDIVMEILKHVGNDVRIRSEFIPSIQTSKQYIRLITASDISPFVNITVEFDLSTLENNEAVYALVENTGDTIKYIYNDTKYVQFTKQEDNTYEYFDSMTPSTVITASPNDTFLYKSIRYTIGSVIAEPLDRVLSIPFYLSALNSDITMNVSATSYGGNINLEDVDCITVFEITTATMREIFKFQTDASDINPDTMTDDIQYMTNASLLPNINIAHANTKNIPEGHIVQNHLDIQTTTGAYTGPYPNNRSLLKHDYVRHLAYSLFNTHHGVDLFDNEKELKDDIVIKGHTILEDIRQMIENANGMTQADTGTDNIGRELLKQIVYHNPARLSMIEDDGGYQSIPFYDGDEIIFNITIYAHELQHNLTGTSTVPSRKYRIILKMVCECGSIYNPIPDDLQGLPTINGVNLSLAGNTAPV